MNIYLILKEGYCGDIDADDSTCHDYHIIRLYSSPYTFQYDLSIDCQVISSCEMVWKGNYFSVNINSHYFVLQNK